MLLFTNDDMRSLLASSLKTATLDQSGWRDSGEGPGSAEGDYINWLNQLADIHRQCRERRRGCHAYPTPPTRSNDIPIYGYIYDVKSGKLVEVPEATTAGRAS
jgi:carbonic anhydrase